MEFFLLSHIYREPNRESMQWHSLGYIFTDLVAFQDSLPFRLFDRQAYVFYPSWIFFDFPPFFPGSRDSRLPD